MRTGQLSLLRIVFLLLMMVVVVGAIIFVERGHRRITVQYAKRVIGRRQYGGTSTHIPLKVNTGGVIPVIFASSILAFPATIALMFPTGSWGRAIADQLAYGMPLYNLLYVVGIVFFCYFYTAIIFNPDDVAENMRKYGGFIPGIRPGKRTAEYIDRILTRITLPGAFFLAFIAVLPDLLITKANVPFYFGGTGLLIVVGVMLDTLRQVESHLLMRHYEGFVKHGRLKGRRG
jgi:preprotein translocase subunit SecY